MPLSEDGRPQGPLPWMLPSLFTAFRVVLLLVVSGLCFAFPCRWLAQNGEWVYPIFTGPLFVLTFCSLLSLHLSDPGILHQGSNELGPMMAPVVWVNHRAFLLQWCPKCCFLRPLRTYHITWCNICVEEFDHHCKWVNNCIGHSNFRVFMLLVQSLCLYSDAMLVTCLIFLVRTIHLPFTTGKIILVGGILAAIPAAGFLLLHFVLLLIKVRSVSAAQRSHEGKVSGPGGRHDTGLWAVTLPLPDLCLHFPLFLRHTGCHASLLSKVLRCPSDPDSAQVAGLLCAKPQVHDFGRWAVR
ncbi:palmitoyltransferase ZDHHC19-like [Equus asinus]|uniref:palmitoyltransferase ZDHHC19-like n=1 Tax=Equus asinus TaxID=9793 RepID=UPI0038F642CC